MGKRQRSVDVPTTAPAARESTTDEIVPEDVLEEEVPLAIHSRSRRTIRQAQDFLVANARLYDVARIYSQHSQPRRSESPCPAPPLAAKTGSQQVVTSQKAAPPEEATTPLTQPSPTPPPPPALLSRTPPASPRQPQRVLSSTSSTQDATPRKSQRPATPPPSARPPPPPTDDTMLELLISTLSGRQASVRILAGRSVNELAARMETLIGLPMQQIRFKCNGVDLPSGPQSLRSLGLRSGDHVLIRLDAGGAPGGSGTTPSPSPFKQRVSLFGHAISAGSGSSGGVSVPASPFKELPSWLRQ